MRHQWLRDGKRPHSTGPFPTLTDRRQAKMEVSDGRKNPGYSPQLRALGARNASMFRRPTQRSVDRNNCFALQQVRPQLSLGGERIDGEAGVPLGHQ
jgi:hypothetical protein